MNEFQQGVREAVKALKIMARGIEIFANAFEKSIEKYEQEVAPPESGAKPEPEKPEPEKKATAKKKPKTAKPAGARKSAPAKAKKTKKTQKTSSRKTTAAKDKPVADREKLRRIIVRSKGGADIETLVKKTGFPQRKVSQMAFHLKKEGKIKNPKKGFYTKP